MQLLIILEKLIFFQFLFPASFLWVAVAQL